MTFPLASLPTEIITYHIARYLGPGDIISLLKCCHIEITADIYNQVFHDGTQFNHYSLQMFLERARSRLYVFGYPHPDKGRFGTMEDLEIVSSPVVKVPFRRICLPFLIEPVGDETVQVAAGRTTIEMLTSKGELYFAGCPPEVYGREPTELVETFNYAQDSIYYDGGLEKMNFVTKVRAREDMSDDFKGHARFGRHVAAMVPSETLDAYYSKEIKPSSFVEVGSAESFFLALDDTGLIWEWSLTRHPKQGIPVLLAENKDEPDETPHLVTGRVLKLRVGSRFNTCLVEGKGIVCWRTREPVNGWRSGYPSFYGRFSLATVNTVPNTAEGILDYAVVGRFVVYLKTDGTVAAMDLFVLDLPFFDPDVDTFPLEELNALSKREGGRFVQINGGAGQEIALVSEDGGVITARVRYEDNQFRAKCTVVEGLRDLDVASVSLGYQHYMALTKQGDVYTWGSEKEFSGCLGPGCLDDPQNVREEYYDGEICLVVTRPTKIKLPGKAYGVCAGRDYSAVLLYSENSMDELYYKKGVK